MVSLHASLEIARRALQTHQLAMSVIGSNIANVNTPGYSRRTTVIRQTTDFDTRAGMVGTGVEAIDVRRGRDIVLDGLFRRQNSNVGRWDAQSSYLRRVETILSEPGEGGLSSSMARFWESWHELAKEPDNLALRGQVIARANALADTFHGLDSHLTSLQGSLTNDITGEIDQINRISDQIATINKSIVEGEVEGHEANALRDQRDLLIDQLSEIVDVQVTEQAAGSVLVQIGSQVLVQDGTSRNLELETGTGNTTWSSRLVWKGGTTEAVVTGGRLRGYLVARDEAIASYRNDLDALASTFVSQVNATHAAGTALDGSTGNLFFDPTGTTAKDISISDAVAANLDLIAASAGGQVGDGDQALAIANLQTGLTMSGGSATFDSFYNTLTGRIGLEAQESNSLLDMEEVLRLDIENQRLQVSGVSLDEEMSLLISHQHAYQAMVRVTATIDEMMSTLISAI